MLVRIPWPVQLRSPRLELRPYATADHDAWLSGFASRLPPQHPLDAGPHDPGLTPRAWFRQMCSRHRQLWLRDRCYILGVFDRKSGEHRGHVDVTILERGNRDWANLGYAVHNTSQRRGIATEASAMVISWSFKALKLHRLEVVVRVDNPPSLGVARKLGLESEGIRHSFEKDGGRWVDHQVFAAIQGRWKPPPTP